MDEPTIPSPSERPLTFGQRLRLRKNIVAALPNLLFALLYAVNIYKELTVLGLTSRMLKLMMELEFLVIHSFPFLALCAILPGDTEKQRKFLRWGFWGLLCLYLFAAGDMGGFCGVVLFAGLTFSTYLGFFFRMFTEQAMIELAVRWFVNFMVFILGISLFDLRKNVTMWIYEERTLYVGMIYFLVLGCLEWSGVYGSTWMGKIAAFIKQETGKKG